jgi:hypothetical protein
LAVCFAASRLTRLRTTIIERSCASSILKFIG